MGNAAPIPVGLIGSARLGDVVGVTAALQSDKCDVNELDNNKYTALYWAAMNGHASVVDILLENKASTSVANENKQEPLHWAAQKGYYEVAKSLMEAGANAEAVSVFGRVPLHNAAMGGYEKVVKLLVDKGANIAAVDDDGKTALHLACEKGFHGVVKGLVKRGADVEHCDAMKNNALHYAAMSGSLDLVKLVADKFKSKVDLAILNNSKGKSAAEYGTKEIREYLAAAVKAAQDEVTKASMGRRASEYEALQKARETKEKEKADKKAAAEAREKQVVQALSPALHAEYLAAKDYPKHLRYEELTKAAIAALNSKDIPGMNKLNAERDELKYVPRDGETADTFKTRLLTLALKLKERRDTLKANKTEEVMVLVDLVKEYMKKTDKLLGGGAGGGAAEDGAADGGNGGEGKKSRSKSTNDVGALAAAAGGGAGAGGAGLDYPRLQITPEDAAYLKRLAAARAPASPRAAKAAAAAGAAGAAAPANTEKVQIKDVTFWRTGTPAAAPPSKVTVFFSLDHAALCAEHDLLSTLRNSSPFMLSLVAEPYAFLLPTDAASLRGGAPLEGHAALAVEPWAASLESHMNKERKAGRWGHGAAAALAALYVNLLFEVHAGGHALLDLRPGALGLYSKDAPGPGPGPKGATNNDWAMKVIDARGAVPLTAHVDVDTYCPAQPLFMAPEVARGNRPPPKKQTAEDLETEAARAKMKALTGIDTDQTSTEEDERRMMSTKIKSKKAKDRDEKEAKVAEQAAKDVEEQRKKMHILKANTWTVGAVLWTLFDEKGQSMLQRCCRVDPAACPEAEIRSKLAMLTQEEVDGFIDKTFARSEYGPLRVTIRGLLQVDAARRGTLDKARKKGAFVADATLAL